jgi:hypothetical protein
VAHASVGDWLEARQRALPVAATTTTATGQTVDWIPAGAQMRAAHLAQPPPSPTHVTPEDSVRPTRAASFDLTDPGPAGHVPIARPDVTGVSEHLDLVDYLSKRGGLAISAHAEAAPWPEHEALPATLGIPGYFHALSSQLTASYGCDGWLNCWDPRVGLPSSPGDDHSISQLWLQSTQKPQLQSIEAGLTVDQSLNGDAWLYLFTFFTTNGYTAEGDDLGGYNRQNAGWVQVHPMIYPGIRVIGTSTPGTPQFELGLKFRLYDGNWWLAVNDDHAHWTWLGYYPASLFAGGIGNHAQSVTFGGEVYSGLANPCSTLDQMGSGRKSGTGFGHAAYQRLLHNQTNAGGTLVNLDGRASVDVAGAGCVSSGYTIACFPSSGPNWGTYQFFGGPSA